MISREMILVFVARLTCMTDFFLNDFVGESVVGSLA